MGGQACVFYGAAEFSRDTDLAIVADVVNLARLRRALDDLQARVIAVPPFGLKYLRKGNQQNELEDGFHCVISLIRTRLSLSKCGLNRLVNLLLSQI